MGRRALTATLTTHPYLTLLAWSVALATGKKGPASCRLCCVLGKLAWRRHCNLDIIFSFGRRNRPLCALGSGCEPADLLRVALYTHKHTHTHTHTKVRDQCPHAHTHARTHSQPHIQTELIRWNTDLQGNARPFLHCDILLTKKEENQLSLCLS